MRTGEACLWVQRASDVKPKLASGVSRPCQHSASGHDAAKSSKSSGISTRCTARTEPGRRYWGCSRRLMPVHLRPIRVDAGQLHRIHTHLGWNPTRPEPCTRCVCAPFGIRTRLGHSQLRSISTRRRGSRTISAAKELSQPGGM